MPSIHRCLLATAALFASALAGAAPPAISKPGNVWYGDLASARGLMVDTAKLYELKRRGQKVEVKAISTVAALDALAQGKVDMVGSARMADPDNAFENELVFTPVAWDAIVMVTSAQNPITGLSLEQIADIYLGRVKNWSELGGPAKEINLYAVAGPDDGVEFSLRQMLLGSGNRVVAAKRWYINTKQLEDALAIDPAALGVTTLSSLVGNKSIKALTVEGTAPSFKTLESGQYLLAAPLYAVTRGPGAPQGESSARARQVLEFMNSEPALRAAWRSRQLVPAVEAGTLAATDAEHRREIAERLAFAVAVVPVNVVPVEQIADQAALIAPASEPAPATAVALPAAAPAEAAANPCKDKVNC